MTSANGGDTIVPKATNLVTRTSDTGDEEELKIDSDVSAPDVTLEEGWRILRDLASLTRNGTLTGTVTAGSTK